MFIEQWGGEVDFSNHEAKVPQNKAVILRFLLSECKVTTRISYFQMKQALFSYIHEKNLHQPCWKRFFH